MSKSIWDVRFTKPKKLAMDAAVKNAFVALDEWLTVHPNGPDNVGRHIELDDEGRIISGMGGSHDGEKLSELKIKSAFPKEYHREETNPDNINHKGFLDRVWGYNRENRESAGQRKYMTQKEYFAKRNELEDNMKQFEKDSPEWKAARQEIENLKEAYHSGVEMEKREGRNALHAEEPKPKYVKDSSRDDHGNKLPKVATPKNLEGAEDYFRGMSDSYKELADKETDVLKKEGLRQKASDYYAYAGMASRWKDYTKETYDKEFSSSDKKANSRSADDTLSRFYPATKDPRGVGKWMVKDMYNKLEPQMLPEEKARFSSVETWK